MSLLRRLFNVARGKVLARGAEAPPRVPDEAPPRPVAEREPAREEPTEAERPAEPRQRRL